MKLERCNLSGETGDAAASSPWTRSDVDALLGLRVRIVPRSPVANVDRFEGTIASAPHYLRGDRVPHYFVDDGRGRGFFWHADDLAPLDPAEARRRLQEAP